MAGTKHFKAVQKQLAKFGYEFNRCNASSHWIYSQNGREDIAVNPSLSDNAARGLLRQLQKAHGIYVSGPKRHTVAIKERQAHERDALKAKAAQLTAERAKILAKRDRHLSGLGGRLSPADLSELIRRLEEIDRERHAIEKLMAAPVGNSHLGTDRRVQHQAGSR